MNKSSFALWAMILFSCFSGVACHTTKSQQTTASGTDLVYEKTETLNLWVNSRQLAALDMQGQRVECLEVKYGLTPGPEQAWELLCEPVAGFDFAPGYNYQLRVKRHHIKDAELLMDRSPYDYELVAIAAKLEDVRLASLAILTVQKIEGGKDGYTATLKNDYDNVFKMLVSIPNMDANYVVLKKGDRVKILGEYTKSGDFMQITPELILRVEE